MYTTSFKIAKMDCPSEEQLIRMKLDGIPDIHHLDFDIATRTLHITHQGTPTPLLDKLDELKLDSSILHTVQSENHTHPEQQNQQRRLLWAVLIINFAFFIIEMLTGLLSNSMGLVADSLDMLADSLVYGLALMAVGSSIVFKKKVAKTAGILQMLLALLGFSEIIRRFIFHDAMPDFRIMVLISVLALLANTASLYLLQKSKSKEAHMRAGMIFTSNDIIINAGVIIAALLVYLSNSALPDLLIGTIVFAIVVRGAFRILKLSQ
jgi:Co/Zn/Cd efflux system component